MFEQEIRFSLDTETTISQKEDWKHVAPETVIRFVRLATIFLQREGRNGFSEENTRFAMRVRDLKSGRSMNAPPATDLPAGFIHFLVGFRG